MPAFIKNLTVDCADALAGGAVGTVTPNSPGCRAWGCAASSG
jgi:hypothetical protein